jgi:hypothetical protein
VPKKRSQPAKLAPPSATGNAGPQFEAKVGAFYALSLLAGGEPRGLPGAVTRTVAFQQRGSGHPLDDVIVQADNADGSPATLEIQAKRTLTFTASDDEFKDVVSQIWQAAQKPEFGTTRYELAVATARTTTRVEHSCQEVLHWARQLPDGATFAAHINREKFASDDMRNFVAVFRANLGAAGAPTDDETVWRLLRRFQILVFDFESPGSDYEHRARERARSVLKPNQAHRAADLWPVLIDYVGACARAGGSRDRAAIVDKLHTEHGFQFDQRADLQVTTRQLAETALQALDEIKDQVGGVSLARTELVDQAGAALETKRILHIVGAPGVGKSSIMKRLAQQLEPEGRIIVLRNGRIISGGWLPMAHMIGCTVSRDELFNELGCGGGATLFIDNIDLIDEPGDWATVTDLLTGVARSPGWRAVVTGGIGNDEWKTKLPTGLSNADIAVLQVGEITDDETAVLASGNAALAMLLSTSHPARRIARNLFYLSRMVELGSVEPAGAVGIATEMDLAKLWWRYGGGRSENGKFARLKALRTMGAQVIARPARVTFKADDLPSPAVVAELLRFDSLREDIQGATVAFRHDVLRDWTVGFQLHQDNELLTSLAMDKPLPPGLARGFEIAARLALDGDPTGGQWSALLALVERPGCHGSWKRPVLLALPRSEHALALFEQLEGVLLEADGQRLREIIRLMITVEAEPIGSFMARLNLPIALPGGITELVVGKGAGWIWLVVWLASKAKMLPTALIPDVVKIFQTWLISTQNQSNDLNTQIIGLLFEWLALLDEALKPGMWHDWRDVPPSLNIPHLKDTRDNVRLTAFSFAHLNPQAAEAHLVALQADSLRHREADNILRAPAMLVRAAPTALVSFMLNTVIEKEDPDEYYESGSLGPFGLHEQLFSPASPGQGSFFELLEHAPAEGLRLVRGIVEHATEWRRAQYRRQQRAFPHITIPFPDDDRTFEGGASVYHWARGGPPSQVTTSALMALEAWGHRQIEAGRPFEEVLHDILMPNGSSIAFVSVAVDLALSHWQPACDAAWPLAAVPELLMLDDARLRGDVAGINQFAIRPEASHWRVKRADLDARLSRRIGLLQTFECYVFHADPARLDALRAALERACAEIRQKPNDDEDPIKGLHATAERALRMTYAEHWPLVKMTRTDGSEIEARQFQRDPREAQALSAEATRVKSDVRHLNLRLQVQAALLDRDKSTPEIVRRALEWAKGQSVHAESPAGEDDDDDDFERKWDRRAVVMAAVLAARDYDAPDRSDIMGWALPVLQTAAAETSDEYRGNDQIEYNVTAIAALGLVALQLKEQDQTALDVILQLASRPHGAVVVALGRHFAELAQLDPRLPRSLIRITMTSAVHPRRGDDDQENEANRLAYQEKVQTSIALEQSWLRADGEEPAWPSLPAWLSRPRRGIRIGGAGEIDADDDDIDTVPDHYVNEHVLGAMIGHLIPLTLGDVPEWLVALAGHLMLWTDEANGPHGEEDDERDHRPSTWNSHFFDFLGILSVALPHEEMVPLVLEPISRFKDDAFHDAMAEFLRGFDRATFATDTRNPENPVAVRAILADRIRKTWNFKRLAREKGPNSETQAANALNGLFYQERNFFSSGRPNIPANWSGLDASMPVLTALVTEAPGSGYLASLLLNLVDSSPRGALLPFVLKAMTAWCDAYGVDPNFWSEKGVGLRVCGWLDRTFFADPESLTVLGDSVDGLTKCLDILVQSGVAQAREIEERIASVSPHPSLASS